MNYLSGLGTPLSLKSLSFGFSGELKRSPQGFFPGSWKLWASHSHCRRPLNPVVRKKESPGSDCQGQPTGTWSCFNHTNAQFKFSSYFRSFLCFSDSLCRMQVSQLHRLFWNLLYQINETIAVEFRSQGTEQVK